MNFINFTFQLANNSDHKFNENFIEILLIR